MSGLTYHGLSVQCRSSWAPLFLSFPINFLAVKNSPLMLSLSTFTVCLSLSLTCLFCSIKNVRQKQKRNPILINSLQFPHSSWYKFLVPWWYRTSLKWDNIPVIVMHKYPHLYIHVFIALPAWNLLIILSCTTRGKLSLSISLDKITQAFNL